MLNSPNLIMKYVYDWLVGLKIGEVFQDRKPYDDTTKQRSNRCYIVFTFDDPVSDYDVYFRGTCSVVIGCRDKAHFVADMVTLDAAVQKFVGAFDVNDDEAGVRLLDVEQQLFDSDDMGNHEYVFTFDVFGDKEGS